MPTDRLWLVETQLCVSRGGDADTSWVALGHRWLPAEGPRPPQCIPFLSIPVPPFDRSSQLGSSKQMELKTDVPKSKHPDQSQTFALGWECPSTVPISDQMEACGQAASGGEEGA